MRRCPLSRRSLLPSLVACAALAACSEGGGDTTTGSTGLASGTGGNAPATSATGAGGAGGMIAGPTEHTLSGDVTWHVTFDADAKAAGATDCSYTRHYEAVEDASAPWICPSCDVLFQADVTITRGADDCYSQVSTTPPSAKEWIGYGAGQWWRSAEGPTTAQGTATIAGEAITTSNMVMGSPAPAGGTLALAVSGNLTMGEQAGDPLHGFVPPDTYACGWPKAAPPAYAGDYVMTKGATLPDGLFLDKCGETVRLHDFAGKYLLVDMAAMDCPPCQAMASQEEQLIADMAAKGIDLQVVTLLCPSLSDVFGEETKTKLDAWINNFDLTTPVLADRGWGVSIFLPAVGDATFGYPTWALVGPDLKVIDFQTGYAETLAEFEAVLDADLQ
jgi:hypothetical protein